ncbi:hypothetical protein DM02DRAFT_711834, partial [Periconia macrospinosa]
LGGLCESGITNDLSNGRLGRELEHPRTLTPVGERGVDILAPLNRDGFALLVQDLATKSVLDSSGSSKRDLLELVVAFDRLLLAFARVLQGEGCTALGSLAAQKNVDFLRYGLPRHSASLLERGIADDGRDLALLQKRPFAAASVGEAGVEVGSAPGLDGLSLLVEQLAADLFVPCVLADEDVYGSVGTRRADRTLLVDRSIDKDRVGPELDSLVAEGYGDSALSAGSALGERRCRAGAGDSGKEERRGSHVEV